MFRIVRIEPTSNMVPIRFIESPFQNCTSLLEDEPCLRYRKNTAIKTSRKPYPMKEACYRNVGEWLDNFLDAKYYCIDYFLLELEAHHIITR
jgi:hypothetical protein